MLSPFLKEAVTTTTATSERLIFHMAVMRWKVKALTTEELDVLRSWIDEQQRSKEKVRVLPWAQEANEHSDPFFAENAHIQRYVI